MIYHCTFDHFWLSVVRRIAFVQLCGLFPIEFFRNSHIGPIGHQVAIFIRHFACDPDTGPELSFFTPINLNVLWSFDNSGCFVATRHLVTVAYFATARIYLLFVHFSTRPFSFCTNARSVQILDKCSILLFHFQVKNNIAIIY